MCTLGPVLGTQSPNATSAPIVMADKDCPEQKSFLRGTQLSRVICGAFSIATKVICEHPYNRTRTRCVAFHLATHVCYVGEVHVPNNLISSKAKGPRVSANHTYICPESLPTYVRSMDGMHVYGVK
jgi:hypothetical protein